MLPLLMYHPRGILILTYVSIFIYRIMRTNTAFGSSDQGSFLETSSVRTNASDSVLFFFLKKGRKGN